MSKRFVLLIVRGIRASCFSQNDHKLFKLGIFAGLVNINKNNGEIIMFNLKNFFAAAILFIGGVTAANAQLVDGSTIKVNVPNAFVLRDETFEAGEYTIERTPSTADSGSLLIMRGNGDSIVFDTMIARSNEAAESTQLVFDRVGDVNYLTEIVVRGQESKNEIPKTKSQKKATSENSSVRHYLTITNTGF